MMRFSVEYSIMEVDYLVVDMGEYRMISHFSRAIVLRMSRDHSDACSVVSSLYTHY